MLHFIEAFVYAQFSEGPCLTLDCLDFDQAIAISWFFWFSAILWRFAGCRWSLLTHFWHTLDGLSLVSKILWYTQVFIVNCKVPRSRPCKTTPNHHPSNLPPLGHYELICCVSYSPNVALCIMAKHLHCWGLWATPLWGGSSSAGRAGPLGIRRLVVHSLTAPVCRQNILEQNINPMLDASIRVWC